MQTFLDSEKEKQFLPKGVPEFQKKRAKLTRDWEKYLIELRGVCLI